MAARPELFHRIDEADSAAARRALSELGLVGQVELRNVFYGSHAARLAGLGGGDGTPALWDGVALHQGLVAVRAALGRLAGASSR